MRKTLGFSNLNSDLGELLLAMTKSIQFHDTLKFISTTKNRKEYETSKSWQDLDGRVEVEMENDGRIKTSSKSDSPPTNSQR